MAISSDAPLDMDRSSRMLRGNKKLPVKKYTLPDSRRVDPIETPQQAFRDLIEMAVVRVYGPGNHAPEVVLGQAADGRHQLSYSTSLREREASGKAAHPLTLEERLMKALSLCLREARIEHRLVGENGKPLPADAEKEDYASATLALAYQDSSALVCGLRAAQSILLNRYSQKTL